MTQGSGVLALCDLMSGYEGLCVFSDRARS